MKYLVRRSVVLLGVCLTITAGCTFNPHDPLIAGDDAAVPEPDGSAGVDHHSGGTPDANADVGPCTPISCSPAGGQYCGQIGDGCNGNQDCGNCPGSQVCGAFAQNVCGDPACTATILSCSPNGGTYCGSISDGCG